MEKKITITSGLEFKIDYGNMDNEEILSTLNSIKRDIEQEEMKFELNDILMELSSDLENIKITIDKLKKFEENEEIKSLQSHFANTYEKIWKIIEKK